MSRVARTVAAGLVVSLCWVVIAAPAGAKDRPVTGGKMTMSASSAIVELVTFLRGHGVTVTSTGPATLEHGVVTWPVVGGSMELPSMHGTMDLRGGLKFAEGNRVLRMRDYELSYHGDEAIFSALISGRYVSLHRIVVARMHDPDVHMSGDTGTMSGGLEITADWAGLINRLLDRHVLVAGADLGDCSATVHAA